MMRQKNHQSIGLKLFMEIMVILFFTILKFLILFQGKEENLDGLFEDEIKNEEDSDLAGGLFTIAKHVDETKNKRLLKDKV